MQDLNEGIKIETLAVAMADTGDACLEGVSSMHVNANMVTATVRPNRLLIGFFTSTDDKLVAVDCFASKLSKVTWKKQRRLLIFQCWQTKKKKLSDEVFYFWQADLIFKGKHLEVWGDPSRPTLKILSLKSTSMFLKKTSVLVVYISKVSFWRTSIL